MTITPQSAGVDPDTRIYARSASDDKGPIVAFLAAMDGLIATKANIPWSIRVVLDGEEEAGLAQFQLDDAENAADVKSDLAVIVDSPRHPERIADGVLRRPRRRGRDDQGPWRDWRSA